MAPDGPRGSGTEFFTVSCWPPKVRKWRSGTDTDPQDTPSLFRTQQPSHATSLAPSQSVNHSPATGKTSEFLGWVVKMGESVKEGNAQNFAV